MTKAYGHITPLSPPNSTAGSSSNGSIGSLSPAQALPPVHHLPESPSSLASPSGATLVVPNPHLASTPVVQPYLREEAPRTPPYPIEQRTRTPVDSPRTPSIYPIDEPSGTSVEAPRNSPPLSRDQIVRTPPQQFSSTTSEKGQVPPPSVAATKDISPSPPELVRGQ